MREGDKREHMAFLQKDNFLHLHIYIPFVCHDECVDSVTCCGQQRLLRAGRRKEEGSSSSSHGSMQQLCAHVYPHPILRLCLCGW